MTFFRTFRKHSSLDYQQNIDFVKKKYASLSDLRYSDSPLAGRSGDRIPVGARFSASVQTGPGPHPASYTMGTWSFLGVKRPERSVDNPPPSSAEVGGRVELYICSPSGPSWPVIGRPLPLPSSDLDLNIYCIYSCVNGVPCVNVTEFTSLNTTV